MAFSTQCKRPFQQPRCLKQVPPLLAENYKKTNEKSKGGFEMTKKLLSFMGFVLLFFALTVNTALVAQEDSEDIEDFSLEELLNVEITTAGKQAEKISEIPASVVLVTREDIETYGYQSLEEILENIPGLYYTNDYYFKNTGVRGFWSNDPNRNLIILVNDIKQTDLFRGAHVFSQINMPVEAIDRIEVVRGPMSVMYGTGAFFGVINIKTNIVGDNPINMISASAGSEKTLKTFARGSGKQGEFQYSFNASFFDNEGLDAPLDEMGAFPGTTKGQLENQEKFFNFSGSFKGFNVDASYTETERGFYYFFPAFSKGSDMGNRTVRFSFGYDLKFSEKSELNLRIGYFLNHFTLEQDLLFPNLYGVELDGASGFTGEMNLFLNPNPKLNISLGLEYRKITDLKNEFTYPAFSLGPLWTVFPEGEGKVTQAIFGQLNYRLSDHLKVVLGARVEQVPEYTIERRFGDFVAGNYTTTQFTYSQTKAEFIPRVALIFSPNENHFFKLLYGKAINQPSLFQIIDNRLGGSYVAPLDPETIQTFELNYIGNLSPKFQVSLSLFRNMLENLIFRTFLTVDGAAIWSQANVGEMNTNGLELTLTARPSKAFHFELSGSYQDTEDKLTDVEPGYSPKFLGYLKASYAFNENVSFAVNGNYVGEMEPYYDVSASARIGEKVDGYFLLGANLRVNNLFGGGVFLNIRGSNLLDQEVRYPATGNNNAYATYGTFGRGLTFLVTLGWKY